jgi:hypothetical protein
MEEVNPDSFKFALSIINDGWVFEGFAQSFLSAVFNYEFIPVGGVGDKGIDGLLHTFSRKSFNKQIFQLSTELDTEGKITNSIEKLIKNNIKLQSFTYVTNRSIKSKDILASKLFDKYAIPVTIFDVDWFCINSNSSQGTRNAYYTYIKSNLKEYDKPGKSYVVSNSETDSRIFVFLRQQFDSRVVDVKINDLLADSLILFSLEGTDPDLSKFKSKDEIKHSIKNYVKFDAKLLDSTIDKRLLFLSQKPRKINYHANIDSYCLPYETRFEITQRNLQDEELLRVFNEQTGELILKYFKEVKVVVKDLTKLVDEVVHKIFYQQGLEFSNFILHGTSQKSIDKDLQEVINQAVDSSTVVVHNKEAVKSCLQIAIRQIVYGGTNEQRRYFKCLSNTYMMMFLLQWNPQVALYFETMASKLKVYVCTSIIIPAFSEYYLEPENRRHWNLLKSAQQIGISLFLSDAIVDELISHLNMIRVKYKEQFEHCEDVYLGNDIDTLIIDEILIRAYFYAKSRGKVNSMNNFIDNFCDPSVRNVKEELIIYLQKQFGLIYKTDESQKIKIDRHDFDLLAGKLHAQGKPLVKAKTDAKIILSIFKMREKNNEISSSGIYGYKTWWLSKDTSTFRAVRSALKDKYPVSCYMRPDFLYNHIVLAPKKLEVDGFYKEIFPGLLGVNLSFHLPEEVTTYVRQIIADHHSKDNSRVAAIIRNLTERLKVDPSIRNVNSIKLYLDEIGAKDLKNKKGR